MNLGKKLLQSREYYQQPFVEHDKIPRKTTKKTIAFYSLFESLTKRRRYFRSENC